MRSALVAAPRRGLLVLAVVLAIVNAPSCAHRGDSTTEDAEVLAETHAWISGQVVDATGEEGLAAIVVSLHSPLLAEPLQATTDAEGAFVFEYQPPGKYALIVQAGESLATVRAAVRAGQRWEPKLAVEVPPDFTPEPAPSEGPAPSEAPEPAPG